MPEWGKQVIEAKTPQAVLGVEGEDARIDSRYVPWLLVFTVLVPVWIEGDVDRIERHYFLPRP